MKKILLAALCLGSLAAPSFAQIQQDKNHYVEYSDWSELKKHKIPEWFEDAKFGIYAHLGPYCVPAYGNEWYASSMYKQTGINRHHVNTYGPLDKFGYKDFIPMFKAEKFDAKEWAKLFADAGAKFAGIVTIHHDGFAMWDSEVNPWNAADKGPKRDIYGQMVSELRKKDMKILATFHHGINHVSYFQDEVKPNDLNDPSAKYLYGRIPKEEGDRRWFEQIKEVIDNYEPDQIWFDFDIRVIDDKWKNRFVSYYYGKEKEWNRELIITRKFELFPQGVGVFDVERGGRDRIYEDLWQTDDAISVNSWCWVENLRLKPASELVHELIDIVSKNGVLLLDACPKADGTIPEDQQNLFREIGHFLDVNGEAIYATRPFRIHGEGDNLHDTGRGKANDSAGKSEATIFGSEDIRYTRSKDGKAIYAFALGWPENGLTLNSFGPEIYGNNIKSISLLGSKSKIKWNIDNEKLQIDTKDTKIPSHQYAYVWKVSLK